MYECVRASESMNGASFHSWKSYFPGPSKAIAFEMYLSSQKVGQRNDDDDAQCYALQSNYVLDHYLSRTCKSDAIAMFRIPIYYFAAVEATARPEIFFIISKRAATLPPPPPRRTAPLLCILVVLLPDRPFLALLGSAHVSFILFLSRKLLLLLPKQRLLLPCSF